VIVKPFDYTPRVAFAYPDDDQKREWKEYQLKRTVEEQRARAEQAEKSAREALARLDTTRNVRNTDYVIRVKRHADYMKPTAVWDDGVRTHIQLPVEVAAHDLPVPKTYSMKGLDSPNYRYDGAHLIIDAIFSRCELLSGAGKHQQKVIIENKNKVTPEVTESADARER
jgi:type IV secretory pathway VirB9-like protein